MLHGTLWDKIPRFAIPVAATAILSQLFNAADIAVIGNFTGELRTVAVAAVGTNSSIISLIVNLFIGIALGANVTIAHAIGEKNDTMVHHAVHTSIVVAVLGGLIAAIIGELFAVPLLNQLNVPDDVFPLALLYLRIYLAGLPVILLYNFEAAVFRSVGETKIPLIALTASGVLNVILNLFFVAVLHMSVDGVAIATVLSNAVSAAILWGFLLKTDKVIRLEPKKLRIDGLCLKQILRIGVPAGVQSAMFSIANIVIQGAINSLGTVVMAASSAAYNIEVITYDILLLAGLHDIRRTELRRGRDQALQENAAAVSSRGHHQPRRRHRSDPLFRKVAAHHLQRRPAGGRDGLYSPHADHAVAPVQPLLRGAFRLPARL